MQFLPEIVAAIKQKRELASLDDTFVENRAQKLLRDNKKLREKIAQAKSFKELARAELFKTFIKQVRTELHKVYGVFDKDEKKTKQELVKKIESNPQDHNIAKEILSLHQSSHERLNQYEEIYKRIFAITNQPSSIIDLACGANPYSYGLLDCRPSYTAIDLPSSELEAINAFFTAGKIEGRAIGIDLTQDHEQLRTLAHADVCFLFKALDSLEEAKRNVSGPLLDAIGATWIVISFPTMSLGGKKHIKNERRAWFEKLLVRRGWPFETFESAAEKFYVVCKEPTKVTQEHYYKEHSAFFAHRAASHDLSDWLERFVQYLDGRNVLDAGCGTGRDTQWLVQRKYTVTGVDLSTKLLDIARHDVPAATFLHADLCALPFPEKKFDGIWCCAVIVHMTRAEAKSAVQELLRVLKPGGVLFLSVKAGTENEIARRDGAIVPTTRFTHDELMRLMMPARIDVLEQGQEWRSSKEGILTDEFLPVIVRKVA